MVRQRNDDVVSTAGRLDTFVVIAARRRCSGATLREANGEGVTAATLADVGGSVALRMGLTPK